MLYLTALPGMRQHLILFSISLSLFLFLSRPDGPKPNASIKNYTKSRLFFKDIVLISQYLFRQR